MPIRSILHFWSRSAAHLPTRRRASHGPTLNASIPIKRCGSRATICYLGRAAVDAATVSPGYDDSLLQRETTSVVSRLKGGLYEAQWQAAVAAQPDWILVTSWNEFWENTHIEPACCMTTNTRSAPVSGAECFAERNPTRICQLDEFNEGVSRS